ncbi:MAG TPA: outer membrane lipoprotein carrier protein LolA [Rhizomicrobium sp.]|jgi:outer membrane lipoprotein-sorting protein|nr:outer membrane lipoprotein carrier protein LolA [Rhizomicrobium sp.]
MHRPALALSLAAALALAAPAGAAPAAYSAAERAELDRVSAALNAIKTLKGTFVQIDPDGDVEQGTFAIAKPGRMRFEYRPPAPTLIVSDGRTVAVQNAKLRTFDRYPLDQTPLGLILGDDVDLAHSHEIVGVSRQPDAFVIKARSRGGRAGGNITITFSEPGLELRQWSVVDNQGLTTTVSLGNVVAGADVSGISFAVPARNPYARSAAN